MLDNLQPPSTNQVQQPSASGLLCRRQILKWGLPLVGAGAVGVLAPACRQYLRDVDYSKLERPLKAGQWKEADLETFDLMLKVANREQDGWLDFDSIQTFPCDVLSRLNQLWVDNSDGKFGFSVQKSIYVDECGGSLDGQYDRDAWLCFANKAGWRKDDTWVEYERLYETNLQDSLAGELPLLWLYLGGELWWGAVVGGWGVSSFALRCATCNIQ